MKPKHILIVASHSPSLIHFRGDFISSLIKHKYRVFTAAPNYPNKTLKDLKDLGATPIAFNLERTGLNPIKDLKSISELKDILIKNNIDLVFPYTVKPVIYSSLAAKATNTSVISLITGLGFSFTGITLKAKTLQLLNESLYKMAIRKNKIVVFQNKDDYQLFLNRNILTTENKVAFVSGSGVNFNKYTFRENHKKTNNVRFLFVARLIKEKGIGLFMESAKVLKKQYPEAEFHVIGAPDQSPSAIEIESLNRLHEQGIIVYHGSQDNVPEHLYNSDVFVLPTYYREGIPRSILEALSVGLPIITTDSPGCRETVKQQENGILIKPQDQEELTKALSFFLKYPEKIQSMGLRSRAYAESRFDVNIINKDLIKLIDEVCNNTMVENRIPVKV